MKPAPTARPDISILVVNWNSRAFVRDCLASVGKHAGALQLEIIVVDNASFDGCEAMVRAAFPEAIFLQSDLNLGFAGANNLAFAHSTGDNILFLNPDTEIQGGALESMLAVLHSQARIGMVGARLLNSDLSLQDNCITALPTIANQALASNFLRTRFPQSGLWGKQAFFNTPQRPVAVEAISGACMLAKREVVESVGCFTTDYFMYCEDMDLCVKIAKAGWAVYYAPDASVVHHAGGSSASRSESDFSSIMIRESLVKYFHLHRGAAYSALYRISTMLASSARLLLLVAASPAGLHPALFPRVSRALRKWTNIWAWSVGATNRAARPLAASIGLRGGNGQRLAKLPEA